MSAEVGDEPRLADARLTGDQQEPHRPGRGRLLQERDRLVEHGLAADRAGGCSGVRCRGSGWNGRCRRGCRDRTRQRWVLAQHRLLQPLDLLGRVDAELLGKSLAQLPQGVECVGLPGALVLREREQRPQPFSVGVLRSQRRQCPLRVVGTAQVDQGPGVMLLDGEQQLLEPAGFGQHGGGVAIGVRPARPEGDCLLARGQPLLRGGDRQRLLGQCLEPPRVHVVDLGRQRVARGSADQSGALARGPVRFELGAQPGDRDLKGAERLAGRIVAPDLGEQPFRGDRGTVRGEQYGEDAALATPGEWLARSANGDRHLSEGGVVHAHAGHRRAGGFPRSRGKPSLPVLCNAREVQVSYGKLGLVFRTGGRLRRRILRPRAR